MTTDNPATNTDCPYLHYLSPEAQTLMAKRATEAAIRENNMTYQAIYLSKVCKTTDKELAVIELAGIVNTLVSHGLVHSTIGHLNALDLYHSPGRHPASVAYAFLMVPTDRFAEAETLAKGYAFPEGCIGDTSFLNVELPRGQFYCNFGISMLETMRIKDFDEEKEVQETVEEILRLMPKGTSLVSYRQCPFLTTAIEYEAIFQNELLSDIKEVFIDYVNRIVEIDGKYEQVRLPVHIRYIPRKDETSSL